MAIITEYINQLETNIPVLENEDLELQLDVYNYDNIETIPIPQMGNTTILREHDNFNFTNHISDFTVTEQGYIPLYVLKSKRNNVKYKYLCYWVHRNGNTYMQGISLTNDPNLDITTIPQGDFSTTYSIYGVATGTSGNIPHLCILRLKDLFGICVTYDTRNGMGQQVIGSNYVYTREEDIKTLLGEVEGRTYNPEYGGISDADGYDPNFDNSSDIITVPNMPSIGVSNVGFVNVYNTTQGALQNLGSDLFPDFEEIPDVAPDTDTLTMLANGFEYLGKNITTLLKSYINSNLVNYIIDCHCLPVTPTVGETEQIKIGFKEFTQSAQRVTSDYVDFDCGALNIKEYYGNFIDYVGTRASLYLPFVGFVPIKNEYFQSGELRVKYRFNIVDGSFMAYVLATSSKSNLKDTVIGTYSGNACVHIPITGVNYSNMVSGVVNGATSIAMGVATSNVGLAVGGALNTMSMRPQMQSSNSYNATSSFLGIRYPYLLIEREVSNFSEQYPNEYGLPLNVTKTISELTGYVEMDENIHIELNCMNEEKEMIKDLLTGGIII